MATKFRFAVSLSKKVDEDGFDAAIKTCEGSVGPIANLCHNALEVADQGVEASEKAIEQTSGIEMSALEKNMTWISLCIATAPMLGFLGTIAGMIEAFSEIAAKNNISPKIVAGGIGAALNTTAFGLTVAVILQFGQNIIMYITDNIVVNIQKSMTVLLQSIAKKNK